MLPAQRPSQATPLTRAAGPAALPWRRAYTGREGARAAGRRQETPRERGRAASPGASPAPPERAGLLAEDGTWASSSGQVRVTRKEAAGGNPGRKRPALLGQGLAVPHPRPNSSQIEAWVARSTPDKLSQHQPFLPKRSPPAPTPR